MLDGHVGGLVLDAVSVEFVGQRRMVHGRMMHGRMMHRRMMHGRMVQGGDTLLECMIVRPFNLIGLSLRLLVRE